MEQKLRKKGSQGPENVTEVSDRTVRACNGLKIRRMASLHPSIHRVAVERDFLTVECNLHTGLLLTLRD